MKTWNTHPEQPKIASPELAQRLRVEDRNFDRQWRKYWNQRGKWNSFEEFKKTNYGEN